MQEVGIASGSDRGIFPMNKLFYGDNLDVMRKFIRPICVETVDLCYIDPPFNSRAGVYNQIYNNIGTYNPSAGTARLPTHGRGTTLSAGLEPAKLSATSYRR